MAKRKTELLVKKGAGSWIDVWCDDALVPLIETIEGIRRFQHMTSGEWTAWLDPRYDADEVFVEIEALGIEEIPIKSVSIEEEARTLGRAAGSVRGGQIILAVTELLEAAEEVCYDVDTYESTLSSLVTDIVERLRQGSW